MSQNKIVNMNRYENVPIPKMAEDLFKTRIFECDVVDIDIISRDYIEQFGMPTSGDAEYDRQMANLKTTRFFTAVVLCQHFLNGARISMKSEPAAELYVLIQSYLKAWKEYMTDPYNFNKQPAPVKDLESLNKLAKAIYPYAQRCLPAEPEKAPIIRGLVSLGRKAFFDDKGTKQKTELELKNERKHEDHTTVFSSILPKTLRTRRNGTY